MKIRTLLLLLVLAAISAFAVLNWGAFMTPTTLSLGFAVVEAPLGLVMLGLTAFLAVFFLLYVVYLQTSALFDTRRHTREMQAQRELADRAEASRFSDLKSFLETELQRQNEDRAELRSALQSRLDKLEVDLRFSVEEAGNTLSAYIGELEDRLGLREDKTPPQDAAS